MTSFGLRAVSRLVVTAFDPACVATSGQEAVDVGAFTENSREIVGSGNDQSPEFAVKAPLKALL